MSSIEQTCITIQTSPESVPAVPPWFGEVTLIVEYLRKQRIPDAIAEQVRFARRRFGQFEVLDFVAVLFGYALSGERTLQAFYERGCAPGPAPSWRSLRAIGCLRARRSVVFSPR